MFIKYVIFIIIHCERAFAFFDPISIGIGAALLGGGFYNYKTIKEFTYCNVYECCTNKYILNDLHNLEQEIKSAVFGQHLVENTLLPALQSHLKGNSKKPLVISFHGPTGTGKNYVSNIVIKHLYKKGIESTYVHKFLLKDFQNAKDIVDYQRNIVEIVRKTVSECARSLFIFDEVEKMPSGILNVLKSYLDNHEIIDGVDYRQTIFIFLSNLAGLEIGDHLMSLMESGKLRENVRLHDFEQNLLFGSYNLYGGLEKSYLIESSLIDHFVPFLPMEQRHVEMCIKMEFQRQYGTQPSKIQIEFVEKNAITYDGIFSNAGCKRVESKIPLAFHM